MNRYRVVKRFTPRFGDPYWKVQKFIWLKWRDDSWDWNGEKYAIERMEELKKHGWKVQHGLHPV